MMMEESSRKDKANAIVKRLLACGLFYIFSKLIYLLVSIL